MEQEIYQKISRGEITNKAAAAALGVHPNTLTSRLQKLKIRRPLSQRCKARVNRITKQEKIKAAKQMVPAQMDIETAAKILNVSTRTLYRWLQS